ncbi:MAG: DNA primase [Gammaproteobacteria bacterium]|nr:DNA primase [Gammaproteobacteria bacterium]
MAGRIPPEFIDELMSRVDIVDVIDERVPLKKAGKEFTACCPFHDEKTPSFTVSPSKQFFHCFGCGVHGTALGFLMDYEHMSFPEAVEDLASRVGLQVPREAGQAPRRDGPPLGDIYTVLERSDKFFRQQLRSHPHAAKAVDYLKERGLSGEIAAEFGIGYAPDGWDNLSKAFGNQAQANEMLTQAGMLIKKESGGSYDRFRDRIMFPIRDARGRTIAFGGRILPGSDESTAGAKYLNSPETPVFHKGRELYGLYEARQALRKLERLLVVEGYMDVVALAQSGIRYAVATLGTATTTEHLNRLYRMVDEVVFCFDGDRAGREAGWRALENALPGMREGRHLRFMFLPDGEDPDSLVRAIGAEAFEQRIAESHTFSEYFLEVLRSGVDIESMEGRAALVEKAKPLLARMPDDALSTMLRKDIADLVNLTPGQLGVAVSNQSKVAAKPRPQSGMSQREGVSPMRTVIRGLLHAPELAMEVGPALRFEELSLPGMGLMIEMVEMVQANPNINLAVLLEHWRGTEHEKALQKLVVEELLLDAEQLKNDFLGALQRLDQQRVAVRQEALLEKSRYGELSQEEKQELNRLLSGQ